VRVDGRIDGGAGWQEKVYNRGSHGISSWEWQGIIAFCACQWKEWMNEQGIELQTKFYSWTQSQEFVNRIIIISLALQPSTGYGLLIHEVSWSHTMTHHGWWYSSGCVISLLQRPLPDNTQHTQRTNIHAPGGVWTHNRSRWAAVDLCVRPCGHWDRLSIE
jgi:hypothetical protein